MKECDCGAQKCFGENLFEAESVSYLKIFFYKNCKILMLARRSREKAIDTIYFAYYMRLQKE